MAPRAIASTTISFGLVTVPVKLYSSGQSSSRVSFNLMHEPCAARVRQQYVCVACDEVVERSDLVKGYEFAKDQYVLFTADELEQIETPVTEGIEIDEFVEADDVDPVYYDRAYYLGPDKGGARAYRLLSKALEDTGRVAIGQYAARGKAYLVMLRPRDGGLVMEQLRYADEVRAFDEIEIGDVEVKKQELELARQLIDAAAAEAFEPAKYEDTVRAQMLAMIEAKVEGEEIAVAPAEKAEPKIIDLMGALKASLEKEGKKPAAKATKKGARKKAEAKKSRKKKSAGG